MLPFKSPYLQGSNDLFLETINFCACSFYPHLLICIKRHHAFPIEQTGQSRKHTHGAWLSAPENRVKSHAHSRKLTETRAHAEKNTHIYKTTVVCAPSREDMCQRKTGFNGTSQNNMTTSPSTRFNLSLDGFGPDLVLLYGLDTWQGTNGSDWRKSLR